MIDTKELRHARNLKEAIECINDRAIRDEFNYFYGMLVGEFQRQIEVNEEKFNNEYEILDSDNDRLISENYNLYYLVNKLYKSLEEINELTNKLISKKETAYDNN